MFYVGTKVQIKPEAWRRFLVEQKSDITKPVPPPQIITELPSHPPYHDKVLLSFPLYWWDEDDLILVQDDYEEVKSLNIRGLNLKIGDKVFCSCEYEVVKFLPVWHSDTKKHLAEHPNNSCQYKWTIGKDCPIHK